MRTHTIVKVEEGSLLVTAATSDGKRVEIQRSVRVPLPEVTRESMLAALRGLDSSLLQGSKGVHVVLGDRRAQHFVATLPPLKQQEAVAFVVREGLRLTGMPSPDQLLVSARLLRTLPGRRTVVAAVALAKNVWEPVGDAFEKAGIPVLGLYASETCLALAAKGKRDESVAALEITAGRGRFVLCDGDAPVRVRRFLVSGGTEQSPETLAAQLAMEVPRTVDWLRESGHPAPNRLVLGTRVEVDDAGLEMLRGVIPVVERQTADFTLPEGDVKPGLGMLSLFRALGAGSAPQSLLLRPEISMPWTLGHVAALTTVAAAGFAFSFAATLEFNALQSMEAEIQSMDEESLHAAAHIAELEKNPELPPPPELTERLQLALSMRRPTSRLVAEISNATTEAIKLDELRFASTDRTVVSGVVDCKTRKEALDAFAAFSEALREFRYVEMSGQEEVGEVPGQPGRLRFKIHLAWRNS